MMLTRSAAWAHRPPLPSSTSFARCLHPLGCSGPRSQAEGPVEPLLCSACARRRTLFNVTLLNRTRNSAASASRPPCLSGRLRVRMLSAHGSCLHSKVTRSQLFLSEFNACTMLPLHALALRRQPSCYALPPLQIASTAIKSARPSSGESAAGAAPLWNASNHATNSNSRPRKPNVRVSWPVIATS